MTDKQEIIELYRKENKAMVNKDVTTLNEILASSMELTHITGYVQSKMEWIDQIQNGEMKYYSSSEETIEKVEVHGNKASLIGKNRVKASIWCGSVSTWNLQMKMYFAKENGKWIITKQVASTY